MKTYTMRKISWVVGMLLVLLLALLVKGCDRKHRDRHPGGPDNAQPKDIYLTMTKTSDLRAKATGYYIKAVGVDDAGNEIWPSIGPIEIENPTFPLSTPITLFVPPCLYRITIGVNLVREPDREKSAVFDVCENSTIDLSILTFEEFRIYENPLRIHTPNPVKGGESVEVSCGTDQFSAPDSDRWPLRVEIWEEGQNGDMINGIKGPFDPYNWFTTTFPDPFPRSSFEEERVFKCFIEDGRSPSETFDESIQRIPPCLVLNEEDSGEGSLRQVLEDAEENQCEVIKFVPDVSKITLSNQLEIPSMTLIIDGGDDGVTVSGNNSTRVLYVNCGADVILQHLTITNGNTAGSGGGIYNNGGTVTVGSDSTVSDNTATGRGGGIYNNGGTVMVNDMLSGNTAGRGGGMYNNGGMIFVNGTVSGNSATNDGGGIYNNGGTITIASGGTVSNSTATVNGGGIYNTNGGTVFVNGTVSGNTAVASGSGIANISGTVIVNGTINGNMTSDDGGGIVNGGTVIVNGTVSGNTAWDNGGGISSALGGTVTINGTVSGNTAGLRGGGIYIWNGMVTVNGTVSGNTATFEGGGIGIGASNLIQGNTATGGGGIWNGGGVALGGAARNYGTGNIPNDCVGLGCP
jgi:hypothetical protein